MTLTTWLAFAAASATGAVARYLVDGAITGRFPWGTLVVNATGSFLCGFLTGLALAHGPRIVLVTGFCGAYTTFSTFTYETVRLVEEGSMAAAVGNVAATALTCAVAAAAGLALA